VDGSQLQLTAFLTNLGVFFPLYELLPKFCLCVLRQKFPLSDWHWVLESQLVGLHEWMGAELGVLETVVTDLCAAFSPVGSANVGWVELLDLGHDLVQEVWSL
jgi:hypothetical protein